MNAPELLVLSEEPELTAMKLVLPSIVTPAPICAPESAATLVGVPLLAFEVASVIDPAPPGVWLIHS